MTEPLVVIPYPGCKGEPIVVLPRKSVYQRVCEYHKLWNEGVEIDGVQIPWRDVIEMLRQMAGVPDES